VEVVGADAPRSLSGRGHLRVGHHQSPFATVLHPLYPRVLEAQRAPDTCACKDVAVLVAETVGGGEDHDVGEVVDKTRAGAITGAVAVPHGPHEEVVGAGMMQDTGVKPGSTDPRSSDVLRARERLHRAGQRSER
jgi:hypothetical protein